MKGEEKKTLNRDEALVRVLERFAKQMDAIEMRLNDIEKLQRNIFASTESFSPLQDSSNRNLSEMKSAILRYHSEMGQIVSAQDHMAKNMDIMTGRQEASATRQAELLREQESLNNHLINLSDRFEVQEKTAGEHYGFSLKQEQRTSELLDEFGQNLSRLHGDTEKLFIKEQQELQNRIQDFRLEATRKMLAFDGIEEVLAVLLHRTEPPEPKPPIWPVRVARKFKSFLRLTFTRAKGKRNKLKTEAEHRKAGKELPQDTHIRDIDIGEMDPEKLERLYEKGYERVERVESVDSAVEVVDEPLIEEERIDEEVKLD